MYNWYERIKKVCVVIMLCFALPLREHPTINQINRFLAMPHYIVTVMLLTAASNLLGLELIVYTLVALTAVYICLLGNDLLPMMPLFVCCYLAPSAGNNPGRNEASVFSGSSGIYLACLAGAIVLALIVRLIRDRARFFAAKPKLLGGMLILTGAYLLSGIGSAAFPAALGKNLLFALLQGAAIILPYWLFSGGVDWKNVRRDYFAWVGFGTGCLLVLQIIGIYCTGTIVIDGVIQRRNIYTGWGMYNNIGGLLAMMIPYAFCLATKYRRGWIGTVAGSAFLICLLLTCSRSSILGGVISYGICVFLMLHYARNRRHNTLALITVIAISLLTVLLFRGQLLRLFSDLLNRGLDPSTRDDIYREGLALFAQKPIFGNSFYSPGYQPWDWSTLDSFSGIFPPRWHNTVVQLLASCGIVGLGAYLFHRLQTARLFLNRMTKENTFIGCSLLVLVGCSLFDCHFFNIGPVLFYSMALSFAENRPEKCAENRPKKIIYK